MERNVAKNKTRRGGPNKKPKFLDTDGAAMATFAHRNLGSNGKKKKKQMDENETKKKAGNKNSKKTINPTAKNQKDKKKAEKKKRKRDVEESSDETSQERNFPVKRKFMKGKHKKRKPVFTLPSVHARPKVPWKGQANSLHLEIANFADYVRLDDKELESRGSFVSVIQKVVHKTHPQAKVVVFGSFATPEVCNFTSDVDITISNAIDIQELPERKKPPRTTTTQAKIQREAMLAKEKTQRLKKKWLSAIKDIDSSDEAITGNGTDSDPFVLTTSDDDTADPLKRDRCDSIESVNLNIAMHSTTVSSARTPMNIRTSKLVRRQVQDCLSSLRRRLNNLKSIYGIQFISSARVPILKIRTSFAVQADICIQEGQETDTRLFAFDCVSTYGKRFSDVVLVLKLLLYQQGLDEPFSGGLGSFKLYALLSRYLSGQGKTNKDLAQVLVGFFLSFQQYSRDIYMFDLQHSDQTQVDLTNVFRLDDIIELFQVCATRLSQHQNLAVLFDVSQLKLDRSRVRSQCDSGAIDADVKKWCGRAPAKMPEATLESPISRPLVAAR